MKIDLFIKTYSKDIKWLRYCILSIQKYVTGYNEIIIILPDGERELIDFELPPNTFVHTTEEEGSGYLYQQYIKMIAHHFSGADFIAYVDSDCIFHSPVNFQDLVKEGKPQILMTSYAEMQGCPWQIPTAEFIGTVPEFEFMRRHVLIYHKSTLENLEGWFTTLRGNLKEYILSRPGGTFSEFNCMGFFAYLYEREKYSFLNTKDWTYVPAIVNQYHSYTQFEEKEAEIRKTLSL